MELDIVLKRANIFWPAPVFAAAILIPDIAENTESIWIYGPIACLLLIWVLSVVRYRSSPRSWRAVLMLIDGVLSSILLFVFLLTWNTYRRLDTYWVFENYYYLFGILWLGSFIAGLHRGSVTWPRRFSGMKRNIFDGKIRKNALYSSFFQSASSRQWFGVKSTVIVGLSAVLGIVASALVGPGYLFLFMSIFVGVMCAFYIASILVRRWYLWRNYGWSYIEIVE